MTPYFLLHCFNPICKVFTTVLHAYDQITFLSRDFAVLNYLLLGKASSTCLLNNLTNRNQMGSDRGSGWPNIWGTKCIDSKHVKPPGNTTWIVWRSTGPLKPPIIRIYNVSSLRKKGHIIMLELDAIQTVTLLIGFCRTPKSKNLEMEESFIGNHMAFVKFSISGPFTQLNSTGKL